MTLADDIKRAMVAGGAAAGSTTVPDRDLVYAVAQELMKAYTFLTYRDAREILVYDAEAGI